MLSYRHAFHAGNHADVLKHVVLVHLLDYLSKKDKPLWYVDTHAGPQSHRLDSREALRNSEFASGIARLWPGTDCPDAVRAYLEQVRSMNPDGNLRVYPGSSLIASRMLRDKDRLRLFELHPTESALLQRDFESASPRVIVSAADGFDALKSVLPPASRRGLTLIDPSYEDKSDYARLRECLRDALQRFATGTYLVWYPIVQRRESHQLPALLKKLTGDWLYASLTVKTPSPDGFGLHGSGVFVLNPPWTLEAALKPAMPYLARILGQDDNAAFQLEARLP